MAKTGKKAQTKAKESRTVRNRLNNDMPNYAIYVLSGTERLLVTVVAFVLGGLTSQVFYGGLFRDADGAATAATTVSNTIFFVAAGILAIKVLLPIYRQNRFEKQSSNLEKQFISLLDSLSASFASGSNVMRAFENAYRDLSMQYKESDFIVRETKEILLGAAQNIGVEDMLRDFGERSGNDTIINFTDVFETCYRKGGNMQSVLLRTNDTVREQILVASEIKTKLTSNLMQLNVMSLMPIGVVALLRGMNASFAAAFATPIGLIVNTVAIGIFVGAYQFGKKVVAIK